MAPATHQPAPSDTKGNASRQLAVVVAFGRRVAPALWRLTFETPTSWAVPAPLRSVPRRQGGRHGKVYLANGQQMG
jgi:hypothetical protein